MVSASCPATSRLNVSAWIRTACGPRPARMRDACANRKSPVKMATELLHRELTDGWPRRTSASSMTSSWNSVARWVSSMATAAWMTRGSFGSPNCAASRTSRARKRLPPASMECLDASVRSSFPGCAVARSDASTWARSSRTSAARAESGKSTGTAVITYTPGHRHAGIPQGGRPPWNPPHTRCGARHSIAPPEGRRPSRAARWPLRAGRWTARSTHEQGVRRVAGQAQDWLGDDAEDDGGDDAEADGGAGEHARDHHLGPVGHRVAEE